MTDEEMVDYLQNRTHLARLSKPEVRDVIARMREDGYEITAIQQPPEPIAEPAEATAVEVEHVD